MQEAQFEMDSHRAGQVAGVVTTLKKQTGASRLVQEPVLGWNPGHHPQCSISRHVEHSTAEEQLRRSKVHMSGSETGVNPSPLYSGQTEVEAASEQVGPEGASRLRQ